MIYRTTPPPPKGDLIAWACRESWAWPAETPQGESYTYWMRFAERLRRRAKGGPALTVAFATPIRVAPSDFTGTLFEEEDVCP